MMTPSPALPQPRLERIRPRTLPRPRVVTLDAPWSWLSAGWRDVLRAPTVSLSYGVIFAALMGVIAGGFAYMSWHALFIALAGGALLVGPIFAVGLYECSRRLARNEQVRLNVLVGTSLEVRGQLLFFGVILLLIALAWMRLAMVLMALFLDRLTVPPLSEFLQLLLFTPQGLSLLVVGTAIGAVLASGVFAISALGVPLLLATRIDAVSAARASIAAVVANPGTMALWAALIVVLMAAGFATLLVGLIVAFPLIGHATWHCYNDIYGSSIEAAPHPDTHNPTNTAP